MKSFRIGIDNYSLHPYGLDPLETMQWAMAHDAEGVAFSGLTPDIREKCDRAYLKDLARYAGDHDLYIEWGGGQHIPYDTQSWKPRDLFENNRRMAEEASQLGTRIVRSCSGGLMRWMPESPATETLLGETAHALLAQKQMLKDHGVILAIETHFEFTTFELRRLIETCDAEPGDWLGICLDTMNLLTMLEDPVLATERILPWVVCTHVKDGGLQLASEGMISFPAGIGEGIIDLKTIIDRLRTLNRELTLSIEDHGGRFELPIFDPLFLSKFPDLEIQEFTKLLRLAQRTAELQEKNRCALTPREKWPDACAARIDQDIQSLKKMTA